MTIKFMENIKDLRQRKGWTIAKVAKQAGLSKTYYWELEQSRKSPGLEVLVKLASAFNVGLDELVGLRQKVICKACGGTGYCPSSS